MTKPDNRESVDSELLRRIQQLPRKIAPDRDLWPVIVNGIQRPQRRVLPIALAAGFLLAGMLLVFKLALPPAEQRWATLPLESELEDWSKQTAEQDRTSR